MATGPAPLGELLSSSWAYYQKHVKTIVIGAVVFALITAVAHWALAGSAEDQAKKMAENMTGLSMEELESLSERMAAGDAEAMAELERVTAEMEANIQGKSDAEVQAMMMGSVASMFKGMLPTLGLSFFVMLIVGIAAAIYYLVIAIEGTQDAAKAAGRIPALFLRVLGLSIWVFVRTFAWIPVIGIIPLIILGPRFILSQVLLIRDGKGIFESASLSYKGTQGYWWKILGNVIVLFIIILVLTLLVNMVLGILGAISSLVMFFGQSLVQQLFVAYGTIFGVKLALTIMEHPKAA